MRSYFENVVFIRSELRRLDAERKRLNGEFAPGGFVQESYENQQERKSPVFACATLQRLLFECERIGHEHPCAPQRDAELLYRILMAFYDER